MEIIKASEQQFPAVRAFYHAMIDELKGTPYDLGWKKDIYPAPDFLMNSLRNGELFLSVEDNEVIASMILNHVGNDSYRQCQWQTEAQDNEITIIHALGVLPSHGGRGIGKRMVQFAIDTAKQNRQKVIRLDVLKGNLPAEKLYTSMGFQKVCTLKMFYENIGWTTFDLYEYPLN